MPRRRPDAGRPVIRAEVEARLARKIRISAATRRRCPKKGCRRAGKCRNFDRCAGVPREPIVFSEAEDRAFRTALKCVLLNRGLWMQRVVGGHASRVDVRGAG